MGLLWLLLFKHPRYQALAAPCSHLRMLCKCTSSSSKSWNESLAEEGRKYSFKLSSSVQSAVLELLLDTSLVSVTKTWNAYDS